MKESLKKLLDEKRFLIMAHRGFWGGNIIQNTTESVILAKKAGAEIIEIDISRNKDGDFYLFHRGHEEDLLGIRKNFEDISSSEVAASQLRNSIGGRSGKYLETLPAFLKHLPGDCLINIDKAWPYFDDPAFWELVGASQKARQIIFKSNIEVEYLDHFQKNAGDYAYMPIVTSREDLEYIFKNYDLNIVAIEMLIFEEDSDLLEEDLIQELKEMGILVLYNSEYLDDNLNLFMGLSDDDAILDNDKTWDLMLDYQADIIQTDWPNFLNEYRCKLGG